MQIKGLRCKKCETVIFSRHKDDEVSCQCGSAHVLGGQGVYSSIKIKFSDKDNYEYVEFQLPCTMSDLRDWYEKDIKGEYQSGKITKVAFDIIMRVTN
ncbi:MAG: DUF7695 domain-containing protein [Peptostreptococcaceae bacterium]